ncbi:MAG: rhomboid family intramembrane serine protease [Xanthomonadales bacterium]|nr:rhomboid family intramembrane serine protease [Xanthomonadales bacterium]
MFIRLEERAKRHWRWATPLTLLLCMGLAVHLQLLDAAERARVLGRYGVLPGLLEGGPTWQWLRLPAALYLHADWTHLLGNMLFLAIFGIATERILRPWRWTLLWLMAGALANFGAAMLASDPRAPIVGASGAVSGLIGAYLSLYPRAHLGIILPLGLYVQFVRVPALHLLGLWLLLQLLLSVGEQAPKVAWSAHLFGFVGGCVLAWVLRPWLYRRRAEMLPRR